MNQATIRTPPGPRPVHGHTAAARRSAELTTVVPTLNERADTGERAKFGERANIGERQYRLLAQASRQGSDRKTVPLLRLA